MNYAIIDLGTNTFNLLIAEAVGNSYRKIFGDKAVVKLGEGGITKGVIGELPFKRGIEALLKHRRSIEKYKAEKVFAFGTSALRDAKNSREFTNACLQKTGIEIHIISGEKEAELIYLGVRQAVDLGSEPSLIMDIGGGSTEFIIANAKEILWRRSFQLGVSRLLEKFSPSDPITKKDVEVLRTHFLLELKPLFSAIGKIPVKILTGSSGSFDSFAEMITQQLYSDVAVEKKSSCDLFLKDLAVIHAKIIVSTQEQRLHMKGLVPFRAENIVISSLLTQFILEKTGIEKVKHSRFSLREGVMWDILNNGNK